MGTDPFHEVDDIDEQGGFYQLQKLKRISTANLKRLNKGKNQSTTDGLLCAPVEDKFNTSLEVLEELSEPNLSCYSLHEVHRSRNSVTSRTSPLSSQSTTPVQGSTKIESKSPMDRRIAESQDRINLLLKELEAKSEPHHQFVGHIFAELRPHLRAMDYIVSHLSSPDDKWSSFIHHVTLLGTAVHGDAAANVVEAFDQARARAMTQLSYALDLWQPQPAGSRRWTLRMQQVCNLWQDSLHDLQFRSLKDIDVSLLDLEDQEELRKVMGMEDLAKALCDHVVRFGQQWEEDREKSRSGMVSVGSTESRGKGPRERTSLPAEEEPYRHSSGRLSSHVASVETIRQADDSSAAKVRDVRIPPTEREVARENFHILSRNYHSMPHFHRDLQWQSGLPEPAPKRTTVFDMGPAMSEQPLGEEQPLKTVVEQALQKGPLSPKMPVGSSIPTIPQVETRPYGTLLPGNAMKESPRESTFALQHHAESPQSISRRMPERFHNSYEPIPSALQVESWIQAAPSPLLIHGKRLPSPDSEQSWQGTSSSAGSSITAGKAKQAWDFVKRVVKEHHETAKATVAAHYNPGQWLSTPESAAEVEISASETSPNTDSVRRDSNAVNVRMKSTLEPVRALPIRPQSVITAFSDLESYRSTSSESSSTTKSYGPVPLPPRTTSMTNYITDRDSNITSLAESSHTYRHDDRFSWPSPRDTAPRERDPIPPQIEHELSVQAPRIASVVSMERNKWIPPSEWSTLPVAPPEAPSPYRAPHPNPRRAPFRLIRKEPRKESSEKVTSQKSENKSKVTPWHTNRTKAPQAQRLLAQRKEAKKARKLEEDYERYKELERRLEANGFLKLLGKKGDENNVY